MPKRKNPFDELPMLYKMHVGPKEVNMGVNYKENMKTVFDKTLSLLYKGSNSASNGLSNERNISEVQTNSKNGANASINVCCQQRKTMCCTFCEKIICEICCRNCFVCGMDFCQLCSVLQYHMHNETAMCLSCH